MTAVENSCQPPVTDESTEHLCARKEELYALSLIYEELAIEQDGVSGTLSIPVEVDGYILVQQGEENSRLVRFLPDVTLHFSTSTGYPETHRPAIHLACSWLSEDHLARIERELERIWEEFRDLCLFSIIEEVSERTKIVFDLRTLEVSQKVFDEICEYSEQEENRRFVAGVYFCEICLENKKGVDCFKLPVCEHIFCTQCLKDYYTLSVTEGQINQVACINQECLQSQGLHFSLPMTEEDQNVFEYISPDQLFPSTLSAILSDNPQIVKRYIRLLKQKFFEKSNMTIYCPRPGCQAPIIPQTAEDLLIICTRCTFAFCRFCRRSWHGDGTTCKLQDGILEEYLESDAEERKLMESRYGEKVFKKILENYSGEEQREIISEKEKRYRQERKNEIASRKYIRENTMSCPRCTLIFQKSAGCNKMTCPRCKTIFCYLCESVLDPKNTYAHFNSETSKTECRGRLFEGNDEEGYQPLQRRRGGLVRERRVNDQVGEDVGWQEYEAQFWEEGQHGEGLDHGD